MKSRNIVLGLASVLGVGLAFAVGSAGCSSSSNPTPANTGPEAGLDSSTVPDTSTGTDAPTTDVTVTDGGIDSATDASDGGRITDAAPPVCKPADYASDSGCTPCGTAPLTACPLAALGVICIPFDNTNVPDAQVP
jgi:hypothetical protein